MDPFEVAFELEGAIQNTVYYIYSDYNEILKIRYDYSSIKIM
jgi:hypothetical protein